MSIEKIDTGTDELLCNVDERVATITLNRPEKRNALSDRLTPALRQTLLDLETRSDVGCIIITGSGSAFCAGGDVGGMGASKTPADAPQPSAEERTRTLIQKQETLTLRLADHAKPTIASLPGVAAGAGLSIALACDIRIAAASTFITTAFRNIGFSGDYGGSWLLTQLIGPSRAKARPAGTKERCGPAAASLEPRICLSRCVPPLREQCLPGTHTSLHPTRGPPPRPFVASAPSVRHWNRNAAWPRRSPAPRPSRRRGGRPRRSACTRSRTRTRRRRGPSA